MNINEIPKSDLVGNLLQDQIYYACELLRDNKIFDGLTTLDICALKLSKIFGKNVYDDFDEFITNNIDEYKFCIECAYFILKRVQLNSDENDKESISHTISEYKVFINKLSECYGDRYKENYSKCKYLDEILSESKIDINILSLLWIYDGKYKNCCHIPELVNDSFYENTLMSISIIPKYDNSSSNFIDLLQDQFETKINRESKEFYFFKSEMSLLSNKYPIKSQPDGNLLDFKTYYPTFLELSPMERGNFFNWLENIEQPASLSYVYLFYYGLERHLIQGNYIIAVDVIIKILERHDIHKMTPIFSIIFSSFIHSDFSLIRKIKESILLINFDEILLNSRRYENDIHFMNKSLPSPYIILKMVNKDFDDFLKYTIDCLEFLNSGDLKLSSKNHIDEFIIRVKLSNIPYNYIDSDFDEKDIEYSELEKQLAKMLLNKLKGDNPTEICQAIHDSKFYHSNEIEEQLVRLLSHREPRVRVTAIYGLNCYQYKITEDDEDNPDWKYYPEINLLVEDSKAEVRKEAIIYISKLGNSYKDFVVEILLDALNDRSKMVRETVAIRLGVKGIHNKKIDFILNELVQKSPYHNSISEFLKGYSY